MKARERGYVLKLARRWHIPVEDRPRGRFPWDGTTIGLGDDFSTVLHDMAHYLLCCARGPERLVKADFGLKCAGGGPEDQREEELSSVLGIEWQRRGGFAWKATAILHSWDDFSPQPHPPLRPDYWDRVDELRERGLLR